MRKALYRLTVALITFAIGVIAAFYLHQSANTSHDQSVVVSRRVEIAKPSTSQPVIKQKPSIRCNNELLRQISNELMNDKAIIDTVAFNNRNSFDCSEEFKIEKVDLNGDGKPEFVVQGLTLNLCSGVGNCFSWIYRKTEKGYEKLLEVDDVEAFNFKRTVSNGYRDLMTLTHDSAFEYSLSVYRFDGAKYQLTECGESSTRYLDKQGRAHIRKKPLITLEKCSE